MIRFLHKFSSVAGKAPAAADLIQRETALNTADSLLYALNSAGQVVCLNPYHEPIYSAGTMSRSNLAARLVGQGVTDSNGRVTVNLTKDNTTTGPAIFSKIMAREATGVMQSGANTAPFVVIESATSKQIVFRCLIAPTMLLLGNPLQFAGAGYTVDFAIHGLT